MRRTNKEIVAAGGPAEEVGACAAWQAHTLRLVSHETVVPNEQAVVAQACSG